MDCVEVARTLPRSRSALSARILPRDCDGRSAGARRLTDLVHSLARRVADPSDPATRALLLDAAHLVMQSETLAHRAARGEAVDPDDVIRTSGALARALDRLEGR